MHDILIKGGLIIDGTGAKGERKDIAINGGVITEIGDLYGDRAREVIDAYDMVVVPGFIDIANRSDTHWRPFTDPQMESMLYQGVTTIIGGNSGASLAPVYTEAMIQSLRKWHDVKNINIDWQNVADFLTTIERRNLAVNFGTFVGYGTLRRGLTGDAARDLTHTEILSMQKHMIEGMRQGALGVSTGLIYSHEKKVTLEELILIGKTVEKYNGVFVAHLRNENDRVVDAVDEILDVHKKTKVRTHISHLKVMEKQNWALMPLVLDKISKTSVLFDVYPYTFSAMVLYTFLPEWVSEGGRRMMLERLRNRKIRQRAVDEMNRSGHDLSHAIVAQTQRSHFYCGKTFRDIAKKQGNSVNDAVMDVLLASDGRVIVFHEGMSEENVARCIQNAHSVISSSGIGLTIAKRNENMEHPRSFEAFPRAFTRYVQKNKICSTEAMVNKCSGKVAQEIGIKDRGVIAAGMRADIAVFDPTIFFNQTDQLFGHRYARGVQWLMVNGQIAIKYGKYTGVRSGQVIRK